MCNVDIAGACVFALHLQKYHPYGRTRSQSICLAVEQEHGQRGRVHGKQIFRVGCTRELYRDSKKVLIKVYDTSMEAPSIFYHFWDCHCRPTFAGNDAITTNSSIFSTIFNARRNTSSWNKTKKEIQWFYPRTNTMRSHSLWVFVLRNTISH